MEGLEQRWALGRLRGGAVGVARSLVSEAGTAMQAPPGGGGVEPGGGGGTSKLGPPAACPSSTSAPLTPQVPTI